MKRISVFILFLVACLGCNRNANKDYEVISFENIQTKSFNDLPNEILKGIEYIPFSSDSLKYTFSMPQKILINNERVFINDYSSRNLYSYKFSGTPEFVLNKRGRAKDEYLQITDFDIDATGGIWILDGQADKIVHYTKDGECLFTSKLPFQADHIKILGNDRLMFTLAEWDNSKFSDYHILVTDRNLNIEYSLIRKTESRDPNFQLVSSSGLHNVNDKIYFHKPISDFVYSIDISDFNNQMYYFEFGDSKVPEEARVNTEDYIDSFDKYSTLSSSIFITEKIVAGGILDKMHFSSFIVDRVNNIKYIQNDDFSDMMFFGISGSMIMYMLRPDSSVYPLYIPETIKTHLDDGGMVMAIVSLDLIEKSL